MSRLSVWWHKFTGTYAGVIASVAGAIFMPIVNEFAQHPEYSADQRREAAIKIATDVVTTRFPKYAWAIELAVAQALALYDAKYGHKG